MLHKTKIKILSVIFAFFGLVCILVCITVGIISCNSSLKSINTNSIADSTTVNTNSIKLLYLTESVSAGSKAKISIQGEPYTEYNISVYYNSGKSTARGLYSLYV